MSLILLIHRHLVDELISICIVLRTPYHGELQLKSSLDQVEITIQAQVFGNFPANQLGKDVQRDSSPSQNRDIIWTGTVDTTQEPMIIVQQENDNATDRHVFVVWRVEAFLSKSRSLTFANQHD